MSNKINRRIFLKQMGVALLFTACGKSEEVLGMDSNDKKLVTRFAVASDLHFGEPNTDWMNYVKLFEDGFSKFNQKSPCDFLVINGDIIHNDPSLLQPAYEAIKDIHPKLFVTQGNHDRVPDEVWEDTWNMGLNEEYKKDGIVYLFGTTSDAKGGLLFPNIEWFAQKLEANKNADAIFIFIHIYPFSTTRFSKEFQELIQKYDNIRGVFNGHDHNDEGIKTMENIPFLFDGRIGGSWGTFDKQFRVVEYYDDHSFLTYLMTPYTQKKRVTFNLKTK